MTTRVTDASVYTDLSGLAALKRDAQAQDPNALREVARQFESLFARMMLKSMREASFGDSLLGSDQQDFYQGMFDDQLSVELTKGKGLGLADMLVQQLSRAGLAGPVTQPPPPGTAGDVKEGNSWQPGSREDFIRDLWPAAQAAGQELGVDPRSLLAQAALETNWGRSMPQHTDGSSSFNLFGIKAGERWAGKATAATTLEVEDGIPVSKRERFRAYDCAQDSFRDYVALLRDNPRYAEALNTGGDTQAFASALQRAGYATDPAYAQKVTAIAQKMASSSAVLKSAEIRPMTNGTRTL